ncbi:MAG TPA: tRNA lysidine(34) synthetase TilS, partial [Acidimicrobiia bacterium]|nr:tRNA lysidine(34) synthetase TilS [Acidimicrobiia bacterium]
MVETRRLKELRGRSTDLLRLPDGDLVVALSGGADSATLAYLVRLLGREVRAVHIDHGLPASDRLAAAARSVAGVVGLGLEVQRIDIPSGPSIEGQARKARYAALLGALQAGETVLTAHTLDDQAETVLMNLLRGAGPSGLAGIPPRTGAVARPMLAVTRSDTRELAGLAGLPFYDDPSNLDRGLRRNVLRLDVIPDLAARFNPRLVESLARSADLVRSDETHLQDEAASVPVLEAGAALSLPLGALFVVPRPVADRALRRCLSQMRPPHGGTADEMEAVWAVARRERPSVVLGGGLAVAHEGPLLVFRPVATTSTPPTRVDLEVGSNTVGPFR